MDQSLKTVHHCSLCQGEALDQVLYYPEKSMSSDDRELALPLYKVECRDCGLVQNGYEFDPAFLEEHYRDEYQLGVQASQSEPLFFSKEGPITRSQAFFRWIEGELPLKELIGADGDILEIGCGEGNLLKCFQGRFSQAKVKGIDMSPDAVALGQKEGLELSTGGYQDIQGRFDLIYSVAVLEHLPSPYHYFELCQDHLKEGGGLLVLLPIQDQRSFDVFFADHLHHFRTEHVRNFGEKAGLIQNYCKVGSELIQGFSLHLFSSKGEVMSACDEGGGYDRFRDNIEYGKHVLERIEHWLKGVEGSMAIWGLGQLFDLFWIYTELRNTEIRLGIEDNIERVKGTDFGFPVYPSDEAFEQLPEGSALLFTFNAPSELKAKVKGKGFYYLDPFKED